MKRLVLSLSAVLIGAALTLVTWEMVVFDAVESAPIPPGPSTTVVREPTQAGYRAAMDAAAVEAMGARDGWIERADVIAVFTEIVRAASVSGAPKLCAQPWTAEADPQLAAATARTMEAARAGTATWPRYAGVHAALRSDVSKDAKTSGPAMDVVRSLRLLVCEVTRKDGRPEAFELGWYLTSLMSQLGRTWDQLAGEFRSTLSRAAIQRACADQGFRAAIGAGHARLQGEPLLDVRGRAKRSLLQAVASLVLRDTDEDEDDLGENVDRIRVLTRLNTEFERLDTQLAHEADLGNLRADLGARSQARQREIAALKRQTSWWTAPLSTPRERVIARSARLADIVIEVASSLLPQELTQHARAQRWSLLALALVANSQTCGQALASGATAADPRAPWLPVATVDADDHRARLVVDDSVLEVAIDAGRR